MISGDGVGMVVKCLGMGWGRKSTIWGWGGDGKKIHGDGVGMGLISNTVSLFNANDLSAVR